MYIFTHIEYANLQTPFFPKTKKAVSLTTAFLSLITI